MSGERGETTLTGLLMAMVVFIAVLGATLQVFAESERMNRTVQERAEAQDRGRATVDRLVRELRNLASPTPDRPLSVDRAGDRDLIFKIAGATGSPSAGNAANVKRVRYCVADNALYRMEQGWTTSAPPGTPGGEGFFNDASCSASGWDSKVIVAPDVTNYASGTGRPLFTYNTTASLDAVNSIHVDLRVDLDPGSTEAEAKLRSGVFLRNQNRAPTASFAWTSTPDGFILDGSSSADPENDLLSYCWYDTAAPTVAAPPKPCPAGPWVGSGITVLHEVPVGATRSIWLEVRDAGSLVSKSPTTTITN